MKSDSFKSTLKLDKDIYYYWKPTIDVNPLIFRIKKRKTGNSSKWNIVKSLLPYSSDSNLEKYGTLIIKENNGKNGISVNVYDTKKGSIGFSWFRLEELNNVKNLVNILHHF